MNSNSVSKSSGLAIASLVLSILSVVIGPFGYVPGIICGHLARANDHPAGSSSGSGLALAGLIIGYVFLVLSVLLLFLFIAFTNVAGPTH